MGIIIHNLIEELETYCLVDISYGKERFEAKVCGKKSELINYIGKETINVELDYDNILQSKSILDFADKDSKIIRIKNYFQIKGRVHNIVKSENDQLIDIFIQSGSDFISILLSEIGKIDVKKGDGVILDLTNLRFYPTNT